MVSIQTAVTLNIVNIMKDYRHFFLKFALQSQNFDTSSQRVDTKNTDRDTVYKLKSFWHIASLNLANVLLEKYTYLVKIDHMRIELMVLESGNYLVKKRMQKKV